MKLLTIIAAVTFTALPAHATMETRQQLGCVLIPIPNTNAWQRMSEGCEQALPSMLGGAMLSSPRPKPRPDHVGPTDPTPPVDPPRDPKPDHQKHDKPKSDNSDSNGKGGNKHDRKDKPQGPKNK